MSGSVNQNHKSATRVV